MNKTFSQAISKRFPTEKCSYIFPYDNNVNKELFGNERIHIKFDEHPPYNYFNLLSVVGVILNITPCRFAGVTPPLNDCATAMSVVQEAVVVDTNTGPQLASAQC